MRIIEWQTDEPCVYDSGNLGYLTAYRVEAELEPGQAVVLIDLEGISRPRVASAPRSGTGIVCVSDAPA